jgi:hypothetical protein
MAASSKIVLHHVGGRWGNHPFPRLPAFAGDFVEVLYEADTDAIAAIQEAGKDRPNELSDSEFSVCSEVHSVSGRRNAARSP